MKEIEKAVKSGGKELSKLKIPIAETWAEAIKLAGGEKEALAKFNSQHVTDTMNKARKPESDPTLKLIAKAMKDEKLGGDVKAQVTALLKKFNIKLD